MAVTCICVQCGGQFRVKPSKVNGARFCSLSCKYASQTFPTPHERPCEHCGTSFVPRNKNPERRFCSKNCQNQWLVSQPISEEASRRRAINSGNTQRGRGKGLSYRKLNGRHEHRVIAEQKLGRALLSDEVVHHIDGNHLNNNPENLQVMSQAEHMREHGLGVPGKSLPWEPWNHRLHHRQPKGANHG